MSPLHDTPILKAHVETCTVCESMYPAPGELTIDAETRTLLSALETYLETHDEPQVTDVELASALERIKALRIDLHLPIDDDPHLSLRITVHLPLLSDVTALAALTVHCPPYLSRSDGDRLTTELGLAAEDAARGELTSLDNPGYIMDASQRVLSLASTLYHAHLEPAPALQIEEKPAQLQRVWFWFPSLSTREKREDLVHYASRWELTGFVLAGKPGILCLEGEASDVDSYMAAIKSESWGDIPSYQKKVTERYRQPITTRAFSGMQEITADITHGGHRGNRGDMGEVRTWMEERGVGDAFAFVVVNAGVAGGR